MSANPNKMEVRRNELLEDVAQRAAARARDLGFPESVSEQLGYAIADDLASHWGGLYITVPKDHYFRLAQRDQVILERYRGGASYVELARAYKMSERGIRMLLNRAVIRDRNINQMSLWEATESEER